VKSEQEIREEIELYEGFISENMIEEHLQGFKDRVEALKWVLGE